MHLTEYTSAELEIAQLRLALQRGRDHIERMQRALDIGLAKQLRRGDELQKQLARLNQRLNPPTP